MQWSSVSIHTSNWSYLYSDHCLLFFLLLFRSHLFSHHEREIAWPGTYWQNIHIIIWWARKKEFEKRNNCMPIIYWMHFIFKFQASVILTNIIMNSHCIHISDTSLHFQYPKLMISMVRLKRQTEKPKTFDNIICISFAMEIWWNTLFAIFKYRININFNFQSWWLLANATTYYFHVLNDR